MIKHPPLFQNAMIRGLYPIQIGILLILGTLVACSLHAQVPQNRNNRNNNSSDTRQYRSNTEVGDALISIDSETRSLIITTDEATHADMQKLIQDLDKPKPQVLIKVLFLEVTYNKDLDLGVEGSFTYRADKGGTLETAFGLAQEVQGGFWRVLVDNWSVTLRALATNGKLEVLSRPSILARNNQEAVIVVGSEVPLITNSRVTDTGQTLNTIQYQDVGIILRVTPFIRSEGLVEMIVAPEISTLTDQTIPISDTASSPVIAKRSAETVVLTPNEKTIIIGGLMENKKTESIRKVPLLGDIPLLGNLFRRTVKDSNKTELLIFLTPSIINNPNDLVDMSQKAVDQAALPEKAFTPEEMEQNLNELTPLIEKDRKKSQAMAEAKENEKTPEEKKHEENEKEEQPPIQEQEE